MTGKSIGRRLFIAAGISALSLSSLLKVPSLHAATDGQSVYRWRGLVLGGKGSILLHMEDKEKAQRLTDMALAEISRLEDIFSLYREKSALSRLNRDGYLTYPPAELLQILSLSRGLWQKSRGLFDPTVQALWRAHESNGTASERVSALRHVGLEKVQWDEDRIEFTKPETALSFNGIAQGFITDKVVDLLRREGLTHSLVQLGETRAIGPMRDGTPWQVALDAMDRRAQLAGEALAVSHVAGTRLPNGASHMLHPKTGGEPEHFSHIAVKTKTAALADGLSTALAFMDEAGARRMIGQYERSVAWLIAQGGRNLQLNS